MNGFRVGGILLIIAGTLGLVYGGFSYNRTAQTTTLGPIGFTIREQQSVNIPVWGSVIAILVGSVVLLARTKRSSP